ncbi:hypothetical protein BGZ90_008532, partial [Linnemannia elongata]
MTSNSANDIANALLTSMPELHKLKELYKLKSSTVRVTQQKVTLLGDIQYPYMCYEVPGQSDWACQLTSPIILPDNIRDIYLIDYGLSNIFSTETALLMGVQACVYSHFGKSGTVTVSGMSSMTFNTTRPNTPHSQHNFGRAFDVKLQGRMKSN